MDNLFFTVLTPRQEAKVVPRNGGAGLPFCRFPCCAAGGYEAKMRLKNRAAARFFYFRISVCGTIRPGESAAASFPSAWVPAGCPPG